MGSLHAITLAKGAFMAKGFRDQRGRPRSGKSHSCYGCPYCHAGAYKKQASRALRRSKRAHIRRSRTEG